MKMEMMFLVITHSNIGRKTPDELAINCCSFSGDIKNALITSINVTKTNSELLKAVLNDKNVSESMLHLCKQLSDDIDQLVNCVRTMAFKEINNNA